jgi:AcrR family transcriptional regulator
VTTRTERRERTRAALQEAALALSEAAPWNEVSIDAIAAAAGVSRRTFFNYFQSKAEVFASLEADPAGSLVAALRRQPASLRPWAALSQALAEVLPDSDDGAYERIIALWREPEVASLLYSARVEMRDLLAAVLRERIPTLEQMGAVLTATLFLSTVHVAAQCWSLDPGTRSLAEVIADALAAVTVRTGRRHPPSPTVE